MLLYESDPKDMFKASWEVRSNWIQSADQWPERWSMTLVNDAETVAVARIRTLPVPRMLCALADQSRLGRLPLFTAYSNLSCSGYLLLLFAYMQLSGFP